MCPALTAGRVRGLAGQHPGSLPRQWLRRLEWVWRGAEVVSGVQPPQPTIAGAWLRAWGRWVLSSDCVGMNDRMNGRTARPRAVAMAAGPRGAGRSPGRVPGSRTCSGGAAASLSGFASRIRIPDSDRFVCGLARSHAHARGGPRPGRRTRTHGTRMRGGPASTPPRAAPPRAAAQVPLALRPTGSGLRAGGSWLSPSPRRPRLTRRTEVHPGRPPPGSTPAGGQRCHPHPDVEPEGTWGGTGEFWGRRGAGFRISQAWAGGGPRPHSAAHRAEGLGDANLLCPATVTVVADGLLLRGTGLFLLVYGAPPALCLGDSPRPLQSGQTSRVSSAGQACGWARYTQYFI